MLGRHALIKERALAGDLSPGCGYGQAGGGSLPVGRRVVSKAKSGKLDLKMKVIVVDDNATLRRIMRHYLQKSGLKKSARPEENILPQAIFWLKK